MTSDVVDADVSGRAGAVERPQFHGAVPLHDPAGYLIGSSGKATRSPDEAFPVRVWALV